MKDYQKKAILNGSLGLLLLLSVCMIAETKATERQIRPARAEAPQTTAKEVIVTGVCTFGDCPAGQRGEPETTETATSQNLAATSQPATEESAHSQVTANSQPLTEPDVEESNDLEVFSNSELLTGPETELEEEPETPDGGRITDPHCDATEETEAETEPETEPAGIYSASYFRQMGVIWWSGWRWTWYSERVLPGTGLNIPGRHSAGGYVRDADGYICLASDALSYGTVIETPFGSYGRVYDCGCDYDTIDVYVSW